MATLEHQVVLVTGGASGIGHAIAMQCARAGGRVMIGDLQNPADLGSAPAVQPPLLFHRTDVSVSTEVASLVRHTVEALGRLDVLVCAAGISGGSGATADYSEADFDRVVAVNLKGVFLCMKYGIPEMIRAGGGAIVNIASIAGIVGLAHTPAYSAAKGGVVQLTKVAALEYAERNIRVNCICPGMIDTPMVHRIPVEAQRQFVARQALQRLGTPDEIAAAAVFLASAASSFTTGSALVVDGGFTAQ